MTIATEGPALLTRARKSDREFDEMMRKVDIFAEELPVLETIHRGIESGYSIGYLAGYNAAQAGVMEAIGIPMRD